MSHLLGPIVFRIGDDKEVRGDEEKAHTVSSDYESFAALRFNAPFPQGKSPFLAY